MLFRSVCFLKGKRLAAWYGVRMFVFGGAASLALFAHLRRKGLDAWYWPLRAVMLVFCVVVVLAAVGPAVCDSWWDRHRPHPA